MQQNSVWFTLWTRPRMTIRAMIEKNPTKNIFLLSIVNGILAAITWLAAISLAYPNEKKFTNPLLILSVILTGIVFALLNLYLGSFLYTWTGSWIGGKGSYREVRCAIGWSNYPYIVSTFLNLSGILLTKHPLVQFPFLLIKSILFIWAFIIFLKILGEAHLFSAWKALVSFILTFAIVFIFAIVLTLAITHFSRPFAKKSQSIKIFD